MKHIFSKSNGLLILVMAVFLTGAAGQAALADDVYLNEIYASHSGTDDREFIELYGTPNMSLDNIVVVVVEGEVPASGTVDQVWDLTGYTMPADGYFVLGNTAVPTLDYDLGASNNIENGAETFYLIDATNVAGLITLIGTDLDTDDDCAYDSIQPSDYGTILDLVCMTGDLTDCCYDGATPIGPDGSYFPAGIWRDEDYSGNWCDNYFLDYYPDTNTTWPRTPGSANGPCPGACCDDASATCVDEDNGVYEADCQDPGDRFLKDGLCDDFDPPCGDAASFALNEIFASHTDTDDMEFIEIIGTASASLDNIMVLIVEGDSSGAGTLDRAWDLTGYTMPADGYFVLGDAAVPAMDYDLGASNTIENGTETIYLLDADNPAAVTALVGTDLDTDNDCVYEVGSEISGLGTILDLVAPRGDR
jgi:hypothetical protein